MVGGAHVRVEEEFARILVGPVRGDGVAFFGVVLDVGHYSFESAVVANQFQGALGPDFGDGVDVVAAEQDAEVDELG